MCIKYICSDSRESNIIALWSNHACLLHYYGITSLILPSWERYKEETKSMLPHSPEHFITDVEQFSIIIRFKSMSFNVFTMAWPNETKSGVEATWPVVCSSGFLLWAGYKSISLPLPSFLAGNDLLNSLVKQPSSVPPRHSITFHLQLWTSQFLFLCKLQHCINALWTQT